LLDGIDVNGMDLRQLKNAIYCISVQNYYLASNTCGYIFMPYRRQKINKFKDKNVLISHRITLDFIKYVMLTYYNFLNDKVDQRTYAGCAIDIFYWIIRINMG